MWLFCSALSTRRETTCPHEHAQQQHSRYLVLGQGSSVHRCSASWALSVRRKDLHIYQILSTVYLNRKHAGPKEFFVASVVKGSNSVHHRS